MERKAFRGSGRELHQLAARVAESDEHLEAAPYAARSLEQLNASGAALVLSEVGLTSQLAALNQLTNSDAALHANDAREIYP